MAQFLKSFSSEGFIMRMTPGQAGAAPDGYSNIPEDPSAKEERLNTEYLKAVADFTNNRTIENGKKIKELGEEYYAHLKTHPELVNKSDRTRANKLKADEAEFKAWVAGQPTQPDHYKPMSRPSDDAAGIPPFGGVGDGFSNPPASTTEPVQTSVAQGDSDAGRSTTSPGIVYSTLPKNSAPAQDTGYGRAEFTPSTDGIYERPSISPRELPEKTKTEITDAIDAARKTSPRAGTGPIAVNDPTLVAGEKALKQKIAKLSDDDFNNLKVQNKDFLKEAAQAALNGAEEVKEYLNKETGKYNFVHNINAAVKHDDKGLKPNQFQEVANAYDRFKKDKTNINGVEKFVEEYQKKNLDKKKNKQEFPLNLVTDVKNQNMVKLCAADPETAAVALEAFKARESKGLNAFKATDLGKGLETAMLAANKHTDPEQKKLATKNVTNIVMNTAAESRYELLSGKVKFDKDKFDAIAKGIQQDNPQEKPTKGFKQVFRDKTGLGGTSLSEEDIKKNNEKPQKDRTKVAKINLNPIDNAAATWKTVTEVFQKNPIKAVGNLVKLAVYNIPKLAVSTLIATPIALVRTLIQTSKDEKNLRLQNVATLATKFPKVYKAVAKTLQKDGKSKVHNKDILKAFKGLGDKAQALQNSTLSLDQIQIALNGKAGHANYLKAETKSEFANKNKLDPIEADKKLGVGKGPSVIENLMRGGSALGSINEKIEKDKLRKEYNTKVFDSVKTVLENQGKDPSAQLMTRVLEGLGKQTAKLLEEHPKYTKDDITAMLEKSISTEPKAMKRFEALAKGGDPAYEVAVAINNEAVESRGDFKKAAEELSRQTNSTAAAGNTMRSQANIAHHQQQVTGRGQ